LNLWDLGLLGVVSLQITAIAYLSRARLKALILSLPFPFTTIALSQDKPIDATHILALLALLVYYHFIRLLHQRLPIVPSIALGLVVYIGVSRLVIHLLPITPHSFWLSALGVGSLALVLFLFQPPRREPNHRTPLPIYFKLPAVAAVVGLLILIKGALQGFATLFPLVGVVGLYEARKGLWSICRQAPVFILGMCALLATVYSTQETLGLAPALLVGWVVYLSLLWPMTRQLWKRENLLGEAESS
jgi:hypothetical protein